MTTQAPTVMSIDALPAKETLTIEFKRDWHRLPDSELVEALVCLANTDGGELWLGVEDDGSVSGLHPDHQSLTGLAALVAARTSPSLAVSVEAIAVNGVTVARIRVPKASSEVATTAGVYLRRRLKADGTPECVAMLPHDRATPATDPDEFSAGLSRRKLQLHCSKHEPAD